MATVQRSPPKKSNTPLRQTQIQTQSEPDINAAILMNENVNVNRNKRARKDNSPQSAAHIGLQDLQATLDSWQADQNSYMSKILGEQTALISKLVSEVKEIKDQNTQIKIYNAEICKSNTEIVQSISFMNNNFEDMRKEIEELKKERQQQRTYIESLERKIYDLQLKSRSSGIEIRNIPYKDSETSMSLTQVVRNIGELVGTHISTSDIRDIYRLPGKTTDKGASRPLIAEFISVQKKQNLVSAVQSYNKAKKSVDDKINTETIGIPGKRQPVFIAEQLPPSSKKLFYLSRDFAKKNDFKYCWVTHGNIYLRKKEGDRQILIKEEKTLQNILSDL